MNKEEFNILLKEADLTQKKLAEILSTSNQTVNNWGNNGRDIPYWVKSWLENYIKKQKFDKAKEIFCEKFGNDDG